MNQKVIRVSHRDMNEYVKQYTEKKLAEKSANKADEIIDDMDAPCSSTFRDEEVAFLLAVLADVMPDDDHEKAMLENIKNTLKNSSETQKNEKR